MKATWSSLAGSTPLRLAIGGLISAACLYLALRAVDLGEVGAILGRAHAGWVLLALGSVAANTLAKAIRWQVLLGEAGRSLRLTQVLVSLLIGQALNTVLPVRVGDLSRAYVTGEQGAGKTFTLATVMVEKLLDMICYALLFGGLLLAASLQAAPLPAEINRSGVLFAALTALVTLGVAGVVRWKAPVMRLLERLILALPGWAQRLAGGRVQIALSSLDVLLSRKDVLRLAVWSAVIWATALLNNYLVLRALNLDLPPTASLLVLVALMAGIAAPSAPGKIGVFEYICILALGLFGVDQTLGLSYGVLLHAIVLLPTTLLGLAFFWAWGAAGRRSELTHP